MIVSQLSGKSFADFLKKKEEKKEKKKVLAYTGPELRYENSLPEVLNVIRLYSSAQRASKRHKGTISAAFRRHCRRPSSKRRLVPFICMALVTVAIIVVVINVRLGPVTNNESASGTRYVKRSYTKIKYLPLIYVS